ncbi:hypothetical protein [Tengunoibacter tsumagoiensis]|uniref:Uncharacterized protein n=1 Tax=Tengunoibacter tsumagoiensis TaxID=2014871 RepID=A0A402A7E7_9CHLR|nr:hypothetical protein [Tengunoibacter tsumagoiensis]GCE14969.1 hypothetical protein KTT_48280 [Tengunoibacter tsumagoiensis]
MKQEHMKEGAIMHIDLRISNAPQMMCFEKAIATVATSLDRRYEMAFSKTLFLSFQIKDYTMNSTADMFSIGDWEIIQLLSTFHSLNFVNKSTIDIDEIEKLLSANIPSVVQFNNELLKGTNDAEKNSTIGPYLVVSGKDDKNIYYHDVHRGLNNHICFEDFFNGATFFHIPELSHTINTQLDCLNFLSEYLHSIKQANSEGMDIYDQIKNFANFIENVFDPMQEFGAENSYNDFLWVLISISRGRGLFALTLKYLSEICNIPEFLSLSCTMQQISSNWVSIRGLIHTFSCSHNFNQYNRKRISRMIKQCAENEKLLINKFLEVATGIKNGIINNAENIFYESRQIVPNTFNYVKKININNYCNEKGFGSLHSIKPIGMSGMGEFFLIDKNAEKMEWIVDNMVFDVCNIVGEQYDNISCNRQVISIDNGDYSTLMLLGCSLLGDLSDVLNVEYIDGYIEEVRFGLTQLNQRIPVFGERIAWEGKRASLPSWSDAITSTDEPSCLFAKELLLKHKSKIKSIILPNCPEIHIFALSLGR